MWRSKRCNVDIEKLKRYFQRVFHLRMESRVENFHENTFPLHVLFFIITAHFSQSSLACRSVENQSAFSEKREFNYKHNVKQEKLWAQKARKKDFEDYLFLQVKLTLINLANNVEVIKRKHFGFCLSRDMKVIKVFCTRMWII